MKDAKEGCLGRVIYDQKYDMIILSWKLKSEYNSDTAKENSNSEKSMPNSKKLSILKSR